ncbi:Mitochondrial proton/calcium exchanger protein [Heracleum sosnowskyi]|uniref:Mitochondrial proton/calcium exchanger protein n=1 Tax=Heracleum sosnowskyi TaxID=360622 RepID=A0AAD8HGN6_9APIA|nr:Mitochondrial proton/calcium exchanger protein [Heracleum sosnowskyi]
MACGAILRRKLIPINTTSAGFIGLSTALMSKNFKNLGSHEFGFVRHASTNTNGVYKAVRTIQNPFLAIARTFNTGIHMTSNDWAIKWSQCKIVYYTIMVRYQLGKKLLRADATITKRLLLKITQGKCLSRRERQLLTRATADIFRLVPGSMFLAVPSIQLVLPLLLRLYPNILSPSFQEKITGQEQVIRNLKARTEYAKFLRDTATEMAKVAQNSQSGQIKPMAEEFLRFWVDFRVCRPVSNEEIFRFVKLFSDELTLDHISRPVMADMCKSMGITPFGTDEYLRFILREKLKSIKNDDKLIQSKGVEALSEAEVRKACRERGIHVAEEMQHQLRDWLDLSLNHAVPSSLLIISRGFIETKKLKREEAMLATLSSLPYELIYLVGVVSLPCNDPRIDKRRKIESLKLQEKVIKEEEEKEIPEMKQSNAIQDDVALKGMTILTPEQARGRVMDEQEQLCELINDATTVLSSALNVSTECDNLLRLFNKEINLCSSNQGRKGLEGEEEVINAYGAAQEANSKDAESDVGDNVSSALLNRANGMLQKLKKETEGVGAKISYRWRVLERYCDGKVSLDVVAAATFLKNSLDREGIQELISHLAKYKEEIEKLGTGAEDIKQGQNKLVHKSEETVTLGVEAEDINQGQNQPGGSGTPLDY